MSLRNALHASPQLFPFGIDERGETVHLLGLSELEYERASFLDSRLLTSSTRIASVSWSEFGEAAADLPLRCHFVFHISHTGSTLLSRLLAACSPSFSLREPAILRLFAEGQFYDRIDTFLGLWSRTFRSDQTAVIKATSFVNEIAIDLMQRVASSRAVLIYIPLSSFLPALLDGAMVDIDRQASSRWRRLTRRGLLTSCSLESLSPGERVAMSWLAEMVSLYELASAFPARTRWLHFERFLQCPELELKQVIDHLGYVSTSDLSLPKSIFHRYAKQPEVEYSKEFRAQLIAQSASRFATEIQRGTNWLHSALRDQPSLASIVNFA